MSHKFYLKDESEEIRPVKCKSGSITAWKVMLLEPVPNVIALFVGPDTETAKLLAGDYVEFLNKKYLDKNINEEWPDKIDKTTHLNYHLTRASELFKELADEGKIEGLL